MTRDQRLWQRYRTRVPRLEEPGAMQLAAYAEGTGTRHDTAAVEGWLAQNPDRLDDVLTARRQFAGSAARPWRTPLADRLLWAGSVAAMLLVAWVSFDLGQASALSDLPADSDSLIITSLLDQIEG
jgi:hypothetical protein